jgi:hypothetical protein
MIQRELKKKKLKVPIAEIYQKIKKQKLQSMNQPAAEKMA